MAHYTLSECMQLLAINNRQLRKLLVTASIIPVTASNDRRMQVITSNDLETLRQLHTKQHHLSQRTDLAEIVTHLQARIADLEQRIRRLEAHRTTTSHAANTTPTNRAEPLESGKSSLPPGYIPIAEFATQYGIPQSTLKKAVDNGRLTGHHNPEGWKHYSTYVRWAFDSDQAEAARALYRPDHVATEE